MVIPFAQKRVQVVYIDVLFIVYNFIFVFGHWLVGDNNSNKIKIDKQFSLCCFLGGQQSKELGQFQKNPLKIPFKMT